MFSFIYNSFIPKGNTFQIKQDILFHSKSEKKYSYQNDESGIFLLFMIQDGMKIPFWHAIFFPCFCHSASLLVDKN